jgi:hypothetical protein
MMVKIEGNKQKARENKGKGGQTTWMMITIYGENFEYKVK